MDIGRSELDFEDFSAAFESLEDPRCDVNQKHPLVSVLAIAVMAQLAGSGGPSAIAEWAVLKAEWLRGLLPLPNGIPRKDVFRRVLSAIHPRAFQACFAEWINRLRASREEECPDRTILNIDGKTLRRSHDHGKEIAALHLVSVYAGQFGLTLAQVACEQKSNEITAVPEALKLVDIQGAVVTLDAMGTQKAIARQIIAGGGDYVFCLKRNQKTLYQTVVDHVEAAMENDFQGIGARRHETREEGHGRREHRLYVQFPVPATLAGRGEWRGLKTIGVVLRTSVRGGKTQSEIRYYISSLPMGVKLFAKSVRGHWAIENGCHWILDVVYREDDSRIREKHLRENFAWLNRFTLSLLKQHPAKTSIAMKRRRCAWNENFLLQVLTGQGS